MAEMTTIGASQYNVPSICTHLLNIERAAYDSELKQVTRLARELIVDLMEERMMRDAQQHNSQLSEK